MGNKIFALQPKRKMSDKDKQKNIISLPKLHLELSDLF